MKLIDRNLINKLTDDALASPRKRAHYNIHEDLNESIHRLCIAVEPGSYVRPHRHKTPKEKWELLTIIRGKMAVIIFDETGKVTMRVELSEESGIKSLEIGADEFHTFVSLESGSAVMEVKAGPYAAPGESDFAQWAPKEGEERAPYVERWYRTAQIGDRCFNENL